VQQQPAADNRQADQNHEARQDGKPDGEPERNAASPASDLCGALAATAATNDLPVDFFTRLIWQESRFKVDAISPKGALGIAQFMPETARLSGLEDPFNPLAAIAKSGELLRGLRQEFGNLGLAAAAYNAGPGRVHDWLGSRRPLPQETRAYVRIVTGRSVEQWSEELTSAVEMPSGEVVPCNLPLGFFRWLRTHLSGAARRPHNYVEPGRVDWRLAKCPWQLIINLSNHNARPTHCRWRIIVRRTETILPVFIRRAQMHQDHVGAQYAGFEPWVQSR